MAQKDKNKRLTPKQELFCQHYVDIGIASEAYRLAYNCANQKPATIWSNASRLLDDSKVSARVEELMASRSKLYESTAHHVIDVDSNDYTAAAVDIVTSID